MERKVRVGLAVGKFDPPHLGHSLVIDVALGNVERLLVFVRTYAGEHTPASLRLAWLREIHPDVEFIGVDDDPSIHPDDREAQAKRARMYLDGVQPDMVFSSEPDDEWFANSLGARHYSVDRDLQLVPVTGSMVRRAPLEHLKWLPPCVRADFVKRVGVVGSESTGKTTLCMNLAARYQTAWVPEYGREYTYGKLQHGRLGHWITEEYYHIAREQQRREDEAARNANKVLICDTDTLSTAIWHDLYREGMPPQWPVPPSKIDLYLLPYPDVTYVADEIRDAEHKRYWMFERFQAEIAKLGTPLIILEGSFAEREAQAARAIDDLVK
jgi:HTH-type transcriptional repressor of NAD biosynthesis genes